MRDAARLPHYYHSLWSCSGHPTVSAAVIPVLLLVALPHLIPIGPPLDVPLGESFRYVCVLNRESFVEL